MGLIDRIKSVLGLGRSPSTSQPGTPEPDKPGDGVDVTVEHEPATASEDAVKGTDTATDAETGADTATVSTDEPDTSARSDAGADASDGETAESSEADAASAAQSADLEEIKGIGPAYATRLNEAGIESVADLAAADADAVAKTADIPDTRLRDWIDRAGEY